MNPKSGEHEKRKSSETPPHLLTTHPNQQQEEAKSEVRDQGVGLIQQTVLPPNAQLPKELGQTLFLRDQPAAATAQSAPGYLESAVPCSHVTQVNEFAQGGTNGLIHGELYQECTSPSAHPLGFDLTSQRLQQTIQSGDLRSGHFPAVPPTEHQQQQRQQQLSPNAREFVPHHSPKTVSPEELSCVFAQYQSSHPPRLNPRTLSPELKVYQETPLSVRETIGRDYAYQPSIISSASQPVHIMGRQFQTLPGNVAGYLLPESPIGNLSGPPLHLGALYPPGRALQHMQISTVDHQWKEGHVSLLGVPQQIPCNLSLAPVQQIDTGFHPHAHVASNQQQILFIPLPEINYSVAPAYNCYEGPLVNQGQQYTSVSGLFAARAGDHGNPSAQRYESWEDCTYEAMQTPLAQPMQTPSQNEGSSGTSERGNRYDHSLTTKNLQRVSKQPRLQQQPPSPPPKQPQTHKQGAQQLTQTVTKYQHDQQHPPQAVAKLDPPPSVLNQLYNYASFVLQQRDISRDVVRVPAVTFNEQKLESKAGQLYQVLREPQTPAVRGQEALSRVCHAMETILRAQGLGAAMITDYKFKECFLRRAPKEVAIYFERPEEGSHDILLFGVNMGVVCIQVTCVEASTNSGTVKKQVRDTLKQLQKDERTVKLMMKDLGVEKVSKVMALPNICLSDLRTKLEPRILKKLAASLGLPEDLTGLLTSDYLPKPGHRYWPDKESRDRLVGWLERFDWNEKELSEDIYKQIFARYTCGWSVPEIWTQQKPRVEIRTLAHAIKETSLRHQALVLTPKQEEYLHLRAPRVVIRDFPGTGTTLLLQLKARLELDQGSVVVIFIPSVLRGLKREYGKANIFQGREDSVFFSSIGQGLDEYISLSGRHVTLKELTHAFAIFDKVSYDQDLARFAFGEAVSKFKGVWVATGSDLSAEQFSILHDFQVLKETNITRIPTSVQTLLRHGSQLAANRQCSESASPHQSMSSAKETGTLHYYSEASSYCGLPTDGPLPVIILHPTGNSEHQSAYDCEICSAQLQSVLMELRLGCRSSRIEDQERRAAEEKTEKALPPTEDDISVNRGNVPPDLSSEDFVVFTDDPCGLDVLNEKLKLLDIFSEEPERQCEAHQFFGAPGKIVYTLDDVPNFVGTERAVVVYVGKLRAGKDEVLQAIFRDLRDVAHLCQSLLVMVLEVSVEPETETVLSDGDSEFNPYRYEMEMVWKEAITKHEKHSTR